MSETRTKHFILKHEKCGGVFTVNSETNIADLQERAGINPDSLGRCPSCGDQSLNMRALEVLLKAYRENEKSLADNGYSIREIKEPIEPDKLKV